MNNQFMLAYIDPGSAGFIIVSILGFLSAVGYTFRRACQRMKDRLLTLLGHRRSEAEEAPLDDAVSAELNLDDEPPR